MKRAIIAGGTFAAIVIGAMAVAVAGAQSSSPTATPVPSATSAPGTDNQGEYKDFFLNDLATRLGVSVDELKGDIQSSQKALVDKALADGKITQSQADDLKARIDAGEKVNFRFALGADHPGIRGAINNIVDEAAKVLGIDSSEVKDGLKAGTSLQDIASAHGMSADAFKTALLAQAKTDLDAKVASGDITQARADEMYQKFSDNIDKIVTDTRGDFGPPFGPHRGGHGGPGRWFGGPDDGANDSGSDSSVTPSAITTTF
jgi:uncharacterized protein YidB (DUF937 family)